MKSVFIRVYPWLLLASQLMAADPISEALQKGLFEEEANHNLDAAIKAYQSVLDQTAEQRKIAATAVFRLGECYRKLNKTNDAIAQYQRLIREFGDQSTLTNLSQQNLVALGVKKKPGSSSSGPRPMFPPPSEEDELERIRSRIKDSPDLLNAKDGNGETPLHKAVGAGQQMVVEFLLANKAHVNAKDNQSGTPLHRAILNGNKSIVELLLTNGADVNAYGGHYSGFDKSDHASYTGAGQPLHVAVREGYHVIATILLSHGADVNARTANGRAALHIAAEKGYLELAKHLVSKDAEVNATDRDGKTPLYMSVAAGHEKMTEFLLANKADPSIKSATTPLIMATKQSAIATIRRLLQHGADVDAQADSDRETALHAAIEQGSPELAKMILEHKPDLEVPSNYGATPLLRAVWSRDPVKVELLLRAGADPNTRDSQGTFALFAAVHNREKKIIKLLLDHKADPNQSNAQGVSAIMYTRDPTNTVKLMNWGMPNLSPSDMKVLSEIGEMLRKHGANENISRLSYIGFTRNLNDSPWQYFTRDPNGHNRHSLMELIASLYQGGVVRRPARHVVPGGLPQPGGQSLPHPNFPDFTRVRIDRLIDEGRDRKQITVNVEEILRSGDCSKDVWLEWGDIVELPKQDHRIDENWPGLDNEFANTLGKCLQRTVTIRVKGQDHSIELAPALHTRTPRPPVVAGVTKDVRTALNDFHLNNVVRISGVLHASSDLRNVKVTRRNPETGQSEVLRFNLEKTDPANDLWLRDGDVIEIPEKT